MTSPIQKSQVSDTSDQATCSRRSLISDPFDDALDVVLSAKHASQQAIKAREKAEAIDELSAKAHAKAESLNRIAISLATTAATVASTALRICGYESFENAYEQDPKYSSKLSLEDMRDILSESRQISDEFIVREINKDARTASDARGRNLKPLDAWTQPDIKKKSSTKKHQLESLPNRDSADLIDLGNDDAAVKGLPTPSSPRRHTLGALNQSVLASFRPIKDDDFNLSGTDRSGKKATESEEKFISSVSPNTHRDSLAASFDSTNAIKPLWEDRYVDDSGKVHVHTIFSSDQKWSDKKAMRQFQMKLQKAKLDSNSSLESANMSREIVSTDNSRIKNKERDVDSSDSEVEDILVAPKPLRQLRELEKNTRIGTQRIHPRNSDITSPRAVSPLLSNNERGCYKYPGDENSPITSPLPHSKPRHIYKPEIFPDESQQ